MVKKGFELHVPQKGQWHCKKKAGDLKIFYFMCGFLGTSLGPSCHDITQKNNLNFHQFLRRESGCQMPISLHSLGHIHEVLIDVNIHHFNIQIFDPKHGISIHLLRCENSNFQMLRNIFTKVLSGRKFDLRVWIKLSQEFC